MRFLQAWEIYLHLPMKSKSILADEGMDWKMVPVTRSGVQMFVMVRTKRWTEELRRLTNASLVYRVLCKCDKCGGVYPLGKMGQHWDSERCRRRAK